MINNQVKWMTSFVPGSTKNDRKAALQLALQRRQVMTSQKLNLCNYGIGWHIMKEQDEKCPLAKNEPVSANW